MEQRCHSQNFSSHNKQENRAIFLPFNCSRSNSSSPEVNETSPIFLLWGPDLTLKMLRQSLIENLLEPMEFLLILVDFASGPDWTGC